MLNDSLKLLKTIKLIDYKYWPEKNQMIYSLTRSVKICLVK